MKKRQTLVLEWKKNKALKFILLPLALFYWGMISCRNLFYSRGFFISKKLPTKIISVGNITVGGTGKTPAAVFIVKALSEKGIKCAVLSRGYGRKTAGTQLVTDGITPVLDWRNYGDEPSLLAKLLPGVPIVVDSKRHRGGMFLVENFKPDIIILDDAFQHRSIERDLDIVLINSKDKKTDHKLLPYGLLREPLSSLRRANVLIFTKTNLTQPDQLLVQMAKSTKLPVLSSTLDIIGFTSLDGRPTSIKKGTKAVALSAIADTSGFIKTIEDFGINVIKHFDFADHHSFKQSEVDQISSQMERLDSEIIITTEKDMVKIANLEVGLLKVYSIDVSFNLPEKDKKTLLKLIQN